MSKLMLSEIGRLTDNAETRRKDLQVAGLHKAKRKKRFTVLAGVLALTSAGAITTVISNAFGDKAVQIAAALTAFVSGTVTLLVTSYYSDDTVFNMLLGSSKYLALRENAYRLAVNTYIQDAERFRLLEELQIEYARLNEIYSRYFSIEIEVISCNAPSMSRIPREVSGFIDNIAPK